MPKLTATVKHLWETRQHDAAISKLTIAAGQGQADAGILAAQLGELQDMVHRGEKALQENNFKKARAYLDQALDSPMLDEWPYPPLDELEAALKQATEPLLQPGGTTPPPEEDDEQQYRRERIERRLQETLSVEEELLVLYEAVNLGMRRDPDGHPIQERLEDALRRKAQSVGDFAREEQLAGEAAEEVQDYKAAEKHYRLAKEILEDLPGQRKRGVNADLYEALKMKVERVQRAGKIQTELPALHAKIAALLEQQAYEQAEQRCQEVLGLVNDTDIQELCSQAEAQVILQRTIKGILESAQIAQDKGEYTRASTILETAQQRYPDAPAIAEAIEKLQTAQQAHNQQVQDLLQEAKESEAQQAFAEAQQKYEAVLALEPDNTTALAGVSPARANAQKLQEITQLIAQAEQEITHNKLRNAQQLYDRLTALNTQQWKRAECDRLSRLITKARARQRGVQETVQQLIDNNSVDWPDEMEKHIEEYRQNSTDSDAELETQIQHLRKKFLAHHYDVIGTRFSAMEQALVTGDIRVGLQKLKPLHDKWQPILTDPMRKAQWPNTSLFDQVLKRLVEVENWLASYEPVEALADKIGETTAFVDETLRTNGHFEQALERVQKRLAEQVTEDDSVYTLLASRYQKLKELETELQQAVDTQHQRNVAVPLGQAEAHMAMEEYHTALDILKRLSSEKWDSTDQQQWRKLYQQAQLGQQIQEWFVMAEDAWSRGEWEAAEMAFRRVHQHIRQETNHHYHQRVVQRLETLSKLQEFDARVRFAIAQTPYTEKHMEKVNQYFSRLLVLAPGNTHINELFERWQKELSAWQHDHSIKLKARAALSREEWKTATSILEELGVDDDIEVVQLQLNIEKVKQVPEWLEKATHWEQRGLETSKIDDALSNWNQSLSFLEMINALDLLGTLGAEAQVRSRKLQNWVDTLRQASQSQQTAAKAQAAHKIEEAARAMREVCDHVSMHPLLHERCQAEYENLASQAAAIRNLPLQAKAALSQGDWQAARQMLQTFESLSGEHPSEIWEHVRTFESASEQANQANVLLQQAFEVTTIQSVLEKLERARRHFERAATAHDAQDDVAIESDVKIGQISIWIANLEQADTYITVAEDAAGHGYSSTAYKALHEAYVLVDRNFVIKERLKEERDKYQLSFLDRLFSQGRKRKAEAQFLEELQREGRIPERWSIG